MREGRQRFHKETGVILNRKISSEGHVSLLCLLKEVGPERLFLPGGGRGKVRMGGSTEPMVWAEFSLYQSTSKEYIREIEVKRDFWPLRARADSLATAMAWCKLLGDFVSWGHPADEVLPVLFWSMDLLEKGADPWGTDLRFVWRVLRALGVAPSLERCDKCGRRISRGFWKDTGFRCERCGERGKGGVPLEMPLLWAAGSPDLLIHRSLSLSERDCASIVREYLLQNLKLLG